MKQFKDLHLAQYRQGDFGYSCATCTHMNEISFHCDTLNMTVDPGYTCKYWESRHVDGKNESDINNKKGVQ